MQTWLNQTEVILLGLFTTKKANRVKDIYSLNEILSVFIGYILNVVLMSSLF